jgi:hypothetical protein
MPKYVISIHAHWESSPDRPTIYVNGDKAPDVVVKKIIDAIVEHNNPPGDNPV